MKKVSTTYSSTLYNKNHMYDSLQIKVNNDVDFSHIRCKFDRSWKSKDETIKYLEWCIKEIQKLEM